MHSAGLQRLTESRLRAGQVLAAIVDKNGMCRWSDEAAAKTHIRQAHEDRIAAMESVLRDIAGASRMPSRAL